MLQENYNQLKNKLTLHEDRQSELHALGIKELKDGLTLAILKQKHSNFLKTTELHDVVLGLKNGKPFAHSGFTSKKLQSAKLANDKEEWKDGKWDDKKWKS